MPLALIALLLLAFAAAGCGGDDEAVPPVAPGAETEPIAPGTETDAESPAGEGDRVQITSCEPVEDAGGGRYEIAGVGTVVVRQEDGRLQLDSVEPAEGWRHEVDDREDDEIEVEFFRDGERLDFELELDDGRLRAEICPDDD
jgi:hypothetical protein